MQQMDINDVQNIDTLGINSDILKGSLSVVAKVTQPFVPLISSVFVIVSEAVKIYKNAKHNKNICALLLIRVNIAKANVEILQLQSRVCDHKAFYRFVEVLKKIKNFMNNISNLPGWKKYILANSVKETFTQLISEFNKSMDDLHFTLAIFNEQQRQQQRQFDQENLNNDIKEMKQFLEIIARGVTDKKLQINTVIYEVQIINKKVDYLIHDPNNTINLKAVKINPKELDDLSDKKINLNKTSIVKKLYQGNDVACRLINIIDNGTLGSQRIQAQLVILGKIKDDGVQMADKGNLRELYENNDINWDEKVHVTLDICRDQNTTFIENINDVVNWMAPEKISGDRYNFKYLDMIKIMEIVTNGGHKKITFGQTNLEYQRLQKGLKEIIIADRILLKNIFQKLHNLSLKCDQPHYQASLYSDSHLDLDSSKSPEISLMKSLEDDIACYLADGIFVKKDIVQAAKLFKEAAEDNNIDACFRYALLMTDKNLGVKLNRERFIEYLTKAADAGNAMAQYNLGDMHLKGKLSSHSNADLGIKYLKLAALNGHLKAEAILKEKHIEIND
ncbi:41354_t:CDS:2 [Gigaspora margarita]|uniref:41354_t:CDS:1 n=1 Tax=Gigaspora margarita TaxID=4874 RepID=A0ABN7UBA8_GIGMA|nr:41354_t:CDS:2 [Gigaspora margarita]